MYLPTVAAAEFFYLFDAKKWVEILLRLFKALSNAL